MKDEKHVPFIAISRETTEKNKTGDQAIEVPGLAQRIAPCQDACPIRQNIPVIMDLIRQGELQQAWEILVDKNPLPLSTSMVCQGFCQQACNRKEFDEFVAFNKIERFLSKMALKQTWWSRPLAEPEASEEKKVAVIGGGPAGLSCTYQLARRGYSVVIFEALRIGGLMKTAIPKDRLPKNILACEIIENILMLPGIDVERCCVNRKKFKEIRKDFDAVFVAVGCHQPKKLGISNENSIGIFYGLDFLEKVNLGKNPNLGKRVVIIGDGNTAIDCALCLAKIPDKRVFVFCEKSRDEIPDFLQKGIEAAEKQRALFFFSMKIQKIDSKNQKIRKVKFWKLGRDGNSGEFKVYIDIDNLIIAIGEEPDTSFVDKDFASEIAGIFFGGNPNNVASAIASGNQGAEKIIAYLEQKEQPNFQEKQDKEIVEFKDLNMAYFEEIPRNKKISDEETAIKEAKRCFSCGTCPGIDNCGVCKMYCPDFCIFEEKKERKLDDHCKGCGICAQECPRGVIKMELKERRG